MAVLLKWINTDPFAEMLPLDIHSVNSDPTIGSSDLLEWSAEVSLLSSERHHAHPYWQ